MPRAFKVFAACSIVSQSDVEPIMMPTSGCIVFADLAAMRGTSLSRTATIWKFSVARRHTDRLLRLVANASAGWRYDKAAREHRRNSRRIGRGLLRRDP